MVDHRIAWAELPRKVQEVRRAWLTDMKDPLFDPWKSITSFSEPQAQQLSLSILANECEHVFGLGDLLSAVEGDNIGLTINALRVYVFLLKSISDVDAARFLQHTGEVVLNTVRKFAFLPKVWDMLVEQIFETWDDQQSLFVFCRPIALSTTLLLPFTSSARALLDCGCVQESITTLLNGPFAINHANADVTDSIKYLVTASVEHELSTCPTEMRLSLRSQQWLIHLFCSLLGPASKIRHVHAEALFGGRTAYFPYGGGPNPVAAELVYMMLQAVPYLVKSVFKESPETISGSTAAIAVHACTWDRMSSLEIQGEYLNRLDLLLSGEATTHLNVKKSMKRIKVPKDLPCIGQDRRRGLLASCSYCGRWVLGTSSLQKCAGCGVARYCGKDCQSSHWPAHKTLCKDLRTLTEQTMAS